MKRDAVFYFANLGADVFRCIRAARDSNEGRYIESLARAHRTLEYLREAKRPEAYEEGLLMLRGLELARLLPDGLAEYQASLSRLISPLAQRLSPEALASGTVV